MDDKMVQEDLRSLGLHFEFANKEQVEAVKKYLNFCKDKELAEELEKENLKEAEKQYRQESKRLSEQLEIVGVSANALDEEGILALNFIAQAASILGTRNANEEDLLLRWTDLVVQDFESTEQHRDLCIRIEDAKQAALRGASVANRLKKCMDAISIKAAENEQFQKKLMEFRERANIEGQRAEKEVKTKKAELEKVGFLDDVRIEPLMRMIQSLEQSARDLKKAEERRAFYSDLPLDIQSARLKLESARAHYKELTEKLLQMMAHP